MAKEVVYIFRPYIRLKNGEVIFASQYGKKAFPIPITKEED